MSIPTYQGRGVRNSNTSVSVAPPYPTAPTPTTNDVFVAVLYCKSSDLTFTTPAGWTYVGSKTGGAGTDGTLDEGPCVIHVYVKESNGTETGSVTFPASGGTFRNATGVIYMLRKATGETWDYSVFTTGSDDAGGAASLAITGAAGLSLAVDDLVLSAVVVNTDNYLWSAEALTASGATFTDTEIDDFGYNAGGTHHRGVLCSHLVTAGSSSSAPSYAATASGSATNNPAGPGLFLRLRASGGGGGGGGISDIFFGRAAGRGLADGIGRGL